MSPDQLVAGLDPDYDRMLGTDREIPVIAEGAAFPAGGPTRWLPLPATCSDCGSDVLAGADIEGPAAQRRLPFDAPRVRRAKR